MFIFFDLTHFGETQCLQGLVALLKTITERPIGLSFVAANTLCSLRSTVAVVGLAVA